MTPDKLFVISSVATTLVGMWITMVGARKGSLETTGFGIGMLASVISIGCSYGLLRVFFSA